MVITTRVKDDKSHVIIIYILIFILVVGGYMPRKEVHVS